ncbi:hypothetical protein [Paenibacillus polymyxa]|uniref:Uncharacterized protein n=1 Tax=Paenibacillus polymyxa (strain SC2) TaxID=886882 RepID=E3EL03_PAEPS|nr:hypothetical protein [Paenibacillus polymyxa]ADO59565.1 hypothetical protein PPSC2_27270 [Paenibacillus polymyxa SC2]WPQ59605.1 hypothetical protein SKN87_28495 [Paenibacillus polymyxa]
MKKQCLVLLSLFVLILLAGCSEDYTIDNAKVVSKSHAADRDTYLITLDKNGSRYSYTVVRSEFDLVNEGALVDVKVKHGFFDFPVEIIPSERHPK